MPSGSASWARRCSATWPEPTFTTSGSALLEAAGELHTTIRLHPTSRPTDTGVSRYSLQTAVGYVCDTTSAVLGLIFAGIFQAYPEFKLVIPHVGGVLPYLIARVDYEARRLQSRGGLACSTSRLATMCAGCTTDSACSSHASLLMAMDVFGAQQVMLGTDYPYSDMPTGMSVMAELPVSDAVLADINSDTAQRLFGLSLATPAE